MRPVILLLALSLTFAACGSTPTRPTSPSSPTGQTPPAGAPTTAVRVSDATGAAPIAGVTATVNSRTMVASDGTGYALLWSDSAGQYSVSFAGSLVVSRTTSLKIPAGETAVALIPAAFDMVAFNEMFRSSQRLQRWTAAPPLIVLTRAVQYEGNYANSPVVLDEEMSDADREQMVRDLSDGFALLTDRQLGGFANITFESPAPGTRVNVMRTGAILIARSKGLTAGTPEGYWGYGRWATTSSGAVVGGNVMLDCDFDGPTGAYPQYRRCLRIHELGHALGYNHVTARQSVMNSAARLEPNAWDRQAVRIAFLRPPGNTAPDNDPSAFSVNARTGAVTWSPPLF